MKKIAFLLATMAIMLSSCKDKNAYTIKGNFNDTIYDGKMAFLQTIANPLDTASKSVVLDSAKIEKGKFVLKGIAKEKIEMQIVSVGKLTEITDNDLDKPIIIKFISEPGDILMEVKDESILVTGTPKNNEYNAINILSNDVLKLYKDVYDGKLLQTEAEEAMSSKMNTMRDSLYSFTKRNMASPLGEAIFISSYANFDEGEIVELISMADESFKSNKVVERLLMDIEVLKRLQVAITDGTLKGMNQAGGETALGEYVGKGKVVLLYFWASSSSSSIEVAKEVSKTYVEYKDRGFDCVGISIDTDKNDWLKAIKANSLPSTQLMDTDGSLADSFGLETVPATILLGKDGKMLQPNLIGERLANALNELLR